MISSALVRFVSAWYNTARISLPTRCSTNPFRFAPEIKHKNNQDLNTLCTRNVVVVLYFVACAYRLRTPRVPAHLGFLEAVCDNGEEHFERKNWPAQYQQQKKKTRVRVCGPLVQTLEQISTMAV